MYRLTINIGVAHTSASYEMADGSEELRLSPLAADLPSARFVTAEGPQLESLAETLRGMVAAARKQLGEEPASVQVTYPASWAPARLLLLWEALVLAGIPDAVTLAVADPKPPVSPPSVDDEESPARTTLLPARAASKVRPGWLVVAAVAAVGAGVVAGVLATGAQQPGRIPGDVESPTVSSAPTRTTERTLEPGVDLPTAEPLASHQFVVPRGRNDATQLNLASVSGVVPPRTLPSSLSGRNSWPLLSRDRRTIIYINYVAGSLRTMAADGSGDRALIESPPRGCGQITRASWSPADQSIMVIECRAQGRPDRLLVIKLDGTVVSELKTGQPRIEDPTISPDGRYVAYWGKGTAGGPNGGSIFTVAMDGSSEPVQLTDRRAGSDADPAWSPDGTMIAFRRRGSNDNLDVYVMRSDGSGVRPVTTGPAVDEKPAWSPDGRQLMIISNRDASGKAGESYDVYVVDVDGGKAEPLGLPANVVLTPVWSYR
jgi:Tol biopolymer transport system component